MASLSERLSRGISDGDGKHRVLLKDLDEPMVGIVSYVRNPAIADARFFSLKSQDTGSASRMPAASLRDQVRGLPARGDGKMLKRAAQRRIANGGTMA